MGGWVIEVPHFRVIDFESVTQGGLRRLTPLGRLIRNAALEFLPEFIAVLRGDLSLVGPLPELLQDDYSLSSMPFRPGIVCPSSFELGYDQTTKQSVRDWYSARLETDVTYLRNATFWTDVKLIIKTIHHGVIMR